MAVEKFGTQELGPEVAAWVFFFPPVKLNSSVFKYPTCLRRKNPPGSQWFESDPCVRAELQKCLVSNIRGFPCQLMSINNYL